MDDVLGEPKNPTKKQQKDEVLILVLMDDVLGGYSNKFAWQKSSPS